MLDLRSFIQRLNAHKEIIYIDHEVDPHLEIAEIHRRIVAADGPALFFKKVRGSCFPVVTNLFGSMKRVHLAFPTHPEKTLEDLLKLSHRTDLLSLSTLWKQRRLLLKLRHLGLKKRSRATNVFETLGSLNELPFLTSWPLDGGPFLTLPLVYTQDPVNQVSNLGMYRIQRFDDTTCGLHFQIGKGGGFHYQKAESLNQDLPVSIFLGGPPALMLSAITPLPEEIPELLLCSFLQEEALSLVKQDTFPHPLIEACEFVIQGTSPHHQKRPEGPFGDHYGYYSLEHPFPFLNVSQILARKGAIYPATVVGKPIQEDYYLGEYLQRLLSPLIKKVMPGVEDLWSYGECGFHALSAAKVKERYSRESLAHAFRILGEGQLSLTKFLILTDQPCDLQDFKGLLTHVLERFRPECDLYIFSNLSMDTLDYTGPKLNKGSKGLLVANGPAIRRLPESFVGPLPSKIKKAIAFCPGCLVIEADSLSEKEKQELCQAPSLANWPMIVLVDQAEETAKNQRNFLWAVFTRFEPAADIYHAPARVHRHHLCYQSPLLIDACMKATYPKELLCDEKTSKKVDNNWKKYFPKGQMMGDSLKAHVFTGELPEKLSLR